MGNTMLGLRKEQPTKKSEARTKSTNLTKIADSASKSPSQEGDLGGG